ncbi:MULTISPECIES: helix-turn-helix domain-containing protein [Yersinia]|uniref:Predicted transcriptional regulator n=1 Tax=Yersinia intermedia TaxID=631 RepID=A0A0H5LZ63_YERIN|nr:MULTISPECIES: helix-turn-helix transcriptional regulator [Yersinia]MCB5309603.1 helix-turn-helix transcriptional regulator [Yersinia massiliensis]CRY56483.1 Predicted transcriptional regulator [Yersinia intermedia]
MAIIITLDVMMAKRKIRSKQLAAAVGITEANLSLMKNGKIKGIKLNTVERLCKALECQPGDLFCYEEDADHE